MFEGIADAQSRERIQVAGHFLFARRTVDDRLSGIVRIFEAPIHIAGAGTLPHRPGAPDPRTPYSMSAPFSCTRSIPGLQSFSQSLCDEKGIGGLLQAPDLAVSDC